MRIPEDILEAAGVTEPECLIELAVHLYAERRLAVAHALRLAGLEFEKELSSNRSATTWSRRGNRLTELDSRLNPRARLPLTCAALSPRRGLRTPVLPGPEKKKSDPKK